MGSFDGLDPHLVWGLIPRFVGLLYLVGFASVSREASMLASTRGLIPIGVWLGRIRRDFPGPRRFFEYPTLLWLHGSDAMLRAIPILGLLCGACAIYGGTIGYLGLAFGWLLWLSLEPLGLIFPWDTMLQEAGFLVLFLPQAEALPSLQASALPLPTVAFVFRWFVMRLMLGFGKDKFIGTQKSDALYLRGFFVWMPLPSPLGWCMHHAPRWVLKASLVFMFFAEVIAPILGLFAGPIRLVAFGALTMLMIGIHATGNWGYFNIGYILLCVCLLDLHSSIFDMAKEPWASQWTAWPDIAVHAVMLILFAVSLLYLPNNTWFTRTWVHWPANVVALPPKWLRVMSIVHRLLAPVRAIAPFRFVNGYGVFPPHSMPPMRNIPVLEGSSDGVVWKQYGYRYMPSFADAPPPFIAPYHPRFDKWTYYMGMGMQTGSLFGSLMPYGNPYGVYTRSTWLDLFAQRLLAGDPLFERTIGHNPFPDQPPKLIRLGMIAMTPTRPAERRATGDWWHVRRLGTLVPPRGIERWPDALIMPEPELFHPDYVGHKRRAQTLRKVASAHASGMPADRAVLEGSDLTAADVRRFWTELIPMLTVDRGQWARIHARADALNERFGVEALYRLERVLERFAWLLRLRIEPHHLGRAQPAIRPMSNFRFHMLLHEIVLDGVGEYEATLADPARAAARAQRTSDATELWVLGLMRYEQMMVHVSCFRWSEMALQSSEKGLPGLFEYYAFLLQQVPRGEDFRPHIVKHRDGEHTIEGLYPPPAILTSTPRPAPSE